MVWLEIFIVDGLLLHESIGIQVAITNNARKPASCAWIFVHSYYLSQTILLLIPLFLDSGRKKGIWCRYCSTYVHICKVCCSNAYCYDIFVNALISNASLTIHPCDADATNGNIQSRIHQWAQCRAWPCIWLAHLLTMTQTSLPSWVHFLLSLSTSLAKKIGFWKWEQSWLLRLWCVKTMGLTKTRNLENFRSRLHCWLS